MSDADLDRCYTALCRALGEVGDSRGELLLAMVALGLIARHDDAEEVLAVLERARESCLDDGPPKPAG